MLRYWPNKSITSGILSQMTTIISYSHLMQFFFVESDSDKSLDGKVVSALINPGNIFFSVFRSIHDGFIC